MSILETQICLWLLVTGQSQLQPQQLRIFVEAHFLQSKFRAIEEARIPGNDAVRKSFQCLSSFIGFVTFTWWTMPKSPWGQKQRTWHLLQENPKTCLPIITSKVSLPTPLPNTLQSGLSDVPERTAEQLNSYQLSGFMKSSNLLALRLCSFSKDKSTCSGRTRPPKS